MPASQQRALWLALTRAGEELRLKAIRHRAVNRLRLEKSFGIWGRELTWDRTAASCRSDRFIAFDKPPFARRDAAPRERDSGSPAQQLVTLELEAVDADASGFEPVWDRDARVSYVTSGAFGHCAGKGLALANLDRAVAERTGAELEVHVVGRRHTAHRIADSPVDPAGARMRS